MKTVAILSCVLLSPWLLAYTPHSPASLASGVDALYSDDIEDDSFNGSESGYDPSSYPGYEEPDDNTIETDSAPKGTPSVEGGSKGGTTHPEQEEKAGEKAGGEKAPSDATEDGSFHEKAAPVKPKPPAPKKGGKKVH